MCFPSRNTQLARMVCVPFSEERAAQFDVSVGIELQLRGESADQECNKCAWKGLNKAAARSTKDVEHEKCTSRGVVVPVKTEVASVEDNWRWQRRESWGTRRKIRSLLVELQRWTSNFTVCIWHSEGWTAGNEALLEAEILSEHTGYAAFVVDCL